MTTDTLFLFGGCAGSFPAPSENRPVFDPAATGMIRREPFLRAEYGGRTTCFLLRHRDTLIVIDHGLGIEPIACLVLEMLRDQKRDGALVHCIQTHFHEDHIAGLHASALMYQAGITLRFYSPLLPAIDSGETVEPAPTMQHVMQHCFRQPYWPVAFSQLAAEFEYATFRLGETIAIDQVRVHTTSLNHPGGCAGLRFELPDIAPIVIATDYEPPTTPDPEIVGFFDGASLLVADMQFRDAEYHGRQALGGLVLPRTGWGHGTPRNLLPAILKCNRRPQRVRISHHDPKRSDSDINQFCRETAALLDDWKATNAFDYGFARDGDTLWI